MKRLDSIAANAAELRRLIRSGVLAGAVLILLVSLPSFVPPLAHLLRPRPTCIHGVDCFWESIKSVAWHLRWPCAALGTITILWGCLLALITRSWRENISTDHNTIMPPHVGTGSSDTDSVSGMSAKEIASHLRGPWTTEASGCAYCTPQRRVRIAIETNGNWDAMRYERRDPYADCDEFAQDLLSTVGDDLSPRDQIALVRALTVRLTAWQVRRGCEDDPVCRCLEDLLLRHRAARALSVYASPVSE